MNLISFRISGAFAAFRDPSVTSNQTVYYIPSKSAVIGILGAMIGIKRSDKLGDIYSNEYKEFFKNTQIGIKFESKNPRKMTFFTNHRSLKESKTKPFKTEVIENPQYTIYIITDAENSHKLSEALRNNEFVYSPYLGHAYCQASVSDFKQIDVKEVDAEGEKTQCVILDESETYNPDFKFKYELVEGDSIIIERHIHHFFNDEKFDGRVLKHWIPTNNSEVEINNDSSRSLSRFYKIGDHVVCMY